MSENSKRKSKLKHKKDLLELLDFLLKETQFHFSTKTSLAIAWITFG